MIKQVFKKYNKILLLLSLCFISFVGGLFYQRYIKVGKQIIFIKNLIAKLKKQDKKVYQVYYGSGNKDKKEHPVLKLINYKKRLNILKKNILGRIEEENFFFNSKQVRNILLSILQARDYKTIAKIEYINDKIFRPEEADYIVNENKWQKHVHKRINNIILFNKILKKKGTHLIYMPVPNLLDVYIPRLLKKEKYISSTFRHSLFLLKLIENDIDVVDLRYLFGNEALRGKELFFKYDLHWNHHGKMLACNEVSNILINSFSELPYKYNKYFSYHGTYEKEPNYCDYFVKFKLNTGHYFFNHVKFLNKKFQFDRDSKIAVFGDSMLDIGQSKKTTGGFTAHLSAKIGYPCYNFSIPGGGGRIPNLFINYYQTVYPKILIWENLSIFNKLNKIKEIGKISSNQLKNIKLKILGISKFDNPQQSVYKNALFSFKAQYIDELKQKKEVIVYTWAFKNRKLINNKKFRVEKNVICKKLILWNDLIFSESHLVKEQLFDDFYNNESPTYFLNNLVNAE